MPARDTPEAANRRDGESRVKTKVDPTAENEVQLTVEIPAEAVKRAYDRLVAKVRGEMVLPGFRKGRVPMDLVVRQVGADYLRAETLEESIPEWGDAALREAGLHDDAVGTSDLEAGPLDEAADYTFSLKVQTMPVPKLGEYKGLKVPQRVVEVTEGQIDAQLAMLQERLAKLEPVEDRAVQTDDFVLMDLEGSQDGKLIEGARTIAVTKCSCRVIDGACGKPLEVCMQLDRAAEYSIERGTGRPLTREQALRMLEQCEEEGLVHVAENKQGVGNVICNCCNDCCLNWTSIRSGLGKFVAPSRFRAAIQAEDCNGCELCVDRCFFDAMHMVEADTLAAVDQDKCMGCGVCRVVCPTDAISMELVRPQDFIPA